MGELPQPETVCSHRSAQLWKALWNWLAFFFQIFVQILRALGHLPLLSSISSSNQFSPLSAIELPEVESSDTDSPEIVRTESTPQQSQKPPPKLTVVLDLDETLVCSYETSSLPLLVRNQAVDAGLKWFEFECVSSDKESNGKPKTNNVTVFERPGLEEFLKQASEFADLILFTAGLEGYAKPLVDRIDVQNLFRLRLYRPSTVSTEYREHVKDLSCVSNDVSRIVIVDNNPFSFLLQPLNGIPCVPFSAMQPHDTQLLDVVLPLIKQLSEEDDVRPMLYQRFRMPEWFHKQGIPITM